MRELLAVRDALAVTDTVLMQVPAGARSRAQREELRRLLSRLEAVARHTPLELAPA